LLARPQFLGGTTSLASRNRCCKVGSTDLVVAELERLRLNNLSPQDGSKKKAKRKGRGYGAGQGGSCGFGMRGQKSRSGPGARPGFEGGQTPLYRRLPKLRGIAGGMPAGQKKFNIVNVGDLNELFEEGEEVTIETLKERKYFKPSGKDRKLPLKVLSDGDLDKPLKFKAVSFSKVAAEKIEAAGGTVEKLAVKPKWTRKLHKIMVEDGTWEKKRKQMIQRKKEKKAAGVL
ncbi:unnamed protein product, partial [Ostreobium quekettii]